MILTVTLNAALDVTYGLDEVEWDGVNRVRTVRRRAGGKGVNVARVLAALGHDVAATGFVGGHTGEAILADLAQTGILDRFFRVDGESRSTLVVNDAASTTLFNEPGPVIGDDELREFVGAFADLVRPMRAVVISGSLPRRVPGGIYGTLAAIAGEQGVPVIVDAEGAALLDAVEGKPALVKPNAAELALALPRVEGDLARAERLRELGAQAVVVSLGAEGVLAVTDEGAFRARLPYKIDGNPTGAGDALVAGLALGLAEGTAWPERLRLAASLGAAAVAAPVAGDFDEAVYGEISAEIMIEGAL
jgi:tagatose 6-phosphate kinase